MSRRRLTFFTGLCVGTALSTDDSSPMVSSLFLLTVMAEYFSATFSLSFTSLLACFNSNFASTVESDMLTISLVVRLMGMTVESNDIFAAISRVSQQEQAGGPPGPGNGGRGHGMRSYLIN